MPKTNEASTIVAGLGLVAINLLIASFSPLLGCILLLLSIAVIIYNIKVARENYVSKKHKCDRVSYSRQHDLKAQKTNCQFYEAENPQIIHFQNLLACKQQKLIQELMQTVPHDGRNDGAILGRAEQFFCKYLRNCFSDKIHTHLALNIPNYKYPYTPDFAYIDSSIGLFIDIEIDEPYTGNKPIHYIGADNNRNKFFLERGWVIIRFAEEQVIKHPKSCCREIARVIAGITGDSTVLKQLARVTALKPVKKWTECEARTMSLNSFRNTYASDIKIPVSGRKLEEPILANKNKSRITEYLIWKYSSGEWHHVGNTCDLNLTNSDRDSNTQILPRGQRPK